MKKDKKDNKKMSPQELGQYLSDEYSRTRDEVRKKNKSKKLK